MIRLEMKNDIMILIEMLQKYQPYNHAKLIIMSILLVKKYYRPIKDKYQCKLNLLILPKEKLSKSK